MVVSPAAILKLCQFRKAFCETLIVSCEPLIVAVAEPAVTVMPCGLAIEFMAKTSIKIPAADRHKLRWWHDLRIRILF